MKYWRFANGMPEGKLLATLRALRESQVDFVLVGGLAAVLNGAPIQTYDVDLVYSREPANIERLLTVLASMDAIFRIQPERRLKPLASHLTASGHLDLLATIGQGLGYSDLLSHTAELGIGEGLSILVLDLELLSPSKNSWLARKT